MPAWAIIPKHRQFRVHQALATERMRRAERLNPTMAPTSSPTATSRLLHCSPARAVLLQTSPDGARPLVTKLLLQGSPQDAEREVAFGQLCAGLDVVQYIAAATDPATGRPCIHANAHDGEDLVRLVARCGALPAARTAALLLPVARTLAAMHGMRSPAAPHGLGHGDLKPGNLLATATTTLLLDFEHAHALDTPLAHGAGTAGFAAPELRSGHAFSASADIYSLGATWRWLLAGGHEHLPPLADEVQQLLQACLASEPSLRPSAALLAEAFRDLASRLADDPAEAAIARWARGDSNAAASLPASHALQRPLQRHCSRLARLQHRLPEAFRAPAGEPTEPAPVARELATAERLLRYAPCHPTLLDWRHRLRQTAARLLAGTAATIQTCRRSEDFDGARQWLTAARSMVAATLRTPGGLPLQSTSERLPGLLQLDPMAFLQHQLDDLEAFAADLAQAAAQVDAAELALDLPAAEQAIAAMASQFGGAAPSVARRRDLLHRLAFYLQRIGRSEPNLERLAALGDRNHLQPLIRFVAACHGPHGNTASSDTKSPPVGLRSLQITLHNLAEEFPHLASRLQTPFALLTQALEQATDRAAELLAEAQQQLRSVPVPVRPLQTTLGKLDSFRILEAFVDRPGRPRSQLLDGIESLRLSLEQARATRDRLAQGAEQALARGHWTTGLFDMERALEGLDADEEVAADDDGRLRERLAEAKRKKQELEAALRRNVELAALYATLQDAAGSSHTERIQALRERRDLLLLLSVQLPGERSQLYRRDLREVETQLALEHASWAEQQLDACDDPEQRLELARGALAAMEDPATDADAERPGRVLRSLEHWRTVAQQCQREVDRIRAEAAARARTRQRMMTLAVVALLACLSALGFATRAWLADDAHAATPGEPR